jgi:hypothetical protein
MRLLLEVDLGVLTGDANDEVARILRYWAGAMKQVELEPGFEQTLMDSAYAPVGTLRVLPGA